MTSTATLTALVELAAERKTQAAQAFAQAADRHAKARERLVLIENYRGDYETRLREQASTGIDGLRVANYNRFIRQLSDALVQQQFEVDRCAQLAEQARGTFLDEERKFRSFEILARRQTEQAAALQARRDQKQIDEFALRQRAAPFSGSM